MTTCKPVTHRAGKGCTQPSRLVAVPGLSHRQPWVRPPFCLGQSLCTCTEAPWTCPAALSCAPGLQSARQGDLLLQGGSVGAGQGSAWCHCGWLAGGCNTTSPACWLSGACSGLSEWLVLRLLLGYLAAPQEAAQGPTRAFSDTGSEPMWGYCWLRIQGGGEFTLTFRRTGRCRARGEEQGVGICRGLPPALPLGLPREEEALGSGSERKTRKTPGPEFPIT